jgi:hypothetical protein
MPPRSNRQQAGDQRGIQFIDLDDFTPGIYSASAIAVSGPPNTVPGPFAAPLGSADASETWQCIGLPGGGLGPLPAMTEDFTLAALGITQPPAGQVGWIGGLLNTGVTVDDELLVAIEYQTGGNNVYYLFSGVVGTAIGNQLYTSSTATPSGGGIGGSPYMFATRVASANPTTTIGAEVIAVLYANQGRILLYPDPANPTVVGIKDISGVTNAMAIFGHQNRICAFMNVPYSWPTPTTVDTNNDAINYTDPPNSETWPGSTPDVVFIAEFPFGYGAFGSMNAGELFLVKCRGGGVIIQGDVNNPNVLWLPGVAPTGVWFGHGDSGLNGFYYCAEHDGCYVWGGGNVSQKVSAQLDDTFYIVSNEILSRCFHYFAKRWNNWMLFSNNYLFDETTGGWWRLLNPSTASLFHYTEGFSRNQLYAAVTQVTGDTTVFLYKFDKTVPASSWQWQSLPIRVSEDRTVNIREIVVRYSNPYGGSGTFTLQLSAIDSAGNVINAQAFTWDIAVNRPQMQRLNLGGYYSEDVTVRVSAQANTPGEPAPVLHSISVGYRTREHAGATE